MTVTAQSDQAAQAGPQGQDGGQPGRLVYALVQTALQQSSLTAIAQHMFCLMLRNMSSDGFVFADPLAGQPSDPVTGPPFSPGTFSAPGCIIAAPSFPADLGTVNQDYVFNWTATPPSPRWRSPRPACPPGQERASSPSSIM